MNTFTRKRAVLACVLMSAFWAVVYSCHTTAHTTTLDKRACVYINLRLPEIAFYMNSLFYVTIPSIVFDDFFSILIIMRLRHNQKRKKYLAPHSLKFPRRFTLNRSAEGRNSKYDSRVLQNHRRDLPTLAHVLED